MVIGPLVQLGGSDVPEITVNLDEIKNLEIEVSGLEGTYTAIKARHDALASKVDRHLAAEVAELNALNARYLDLCDELGQEATERIFDSNKPKEPPLDLEKADALSKKLFRALAALVHPDKCDSRFEGVFETACKMRKDRDVAGLTSLLDSVKSMRKTGSPLLMKLNNLLNRKQELLDSIESLRKSSIEQFVQIEDKGRFDVVLQIIREDRMQSALKLRMLINALQAKKNK